MEYLSPPDYAEIKWDRGLYNHHAVHFTGGDIVEFNGLADSAANFKTQKKTAFIRLRKLLPADKGWVVVGQIPYHLRQEAVKRAEEMINSVEDYCLVFNNCEHVAKYIVSGDRISYQVRQLTPLVVPVIFVLALPFVVVWALISPKEKRTKDKSSWDDDDY